MTCTVVRIIHMIASEEDHWRLPPALLLYVVPFPSGPAESCPCWFDRSSANTISVQSLSFFSFDSQSKKDGIEFIP